MNVVLNDYIKKAREKNLSDEQIKDHLSEIGWSKENIVEALAYVSDLPVPPSPIAKNLNVWKFSIFYLVFFLSLSLLAISSAGILHNWIDNYLLIPLTGNSNATPSFYDFISDYYALGVIQTIQIYIPTVIVSYLFSLLLVFFLKKQELKHPLIKETKFYKVCMYGTLGTTLLVIISQLITAGYGYLSGDPASTTFRHVLVTILTSGIVFSYFFIETKRFGEIRKDILALIYITALAVFALYYGFSLIPSAITERNITFDHKRVINLGNLQSAIDNYYTTNGFLPQSLNILTSDSSVTSSLSTPLVKFDPQTRQPYEYVITSQTDYQLCATFSTDSSKDDANGYDDANGDYSSYKDQFTHHIGHQCFDETENSNTTPDNTDTSGNNGPVPTMTCLGGGCPQSSPMPSGAIDTPTPFPSNQNLKGVGGGSGGSL